MTTPTEQLYLLFGQRHAADARTALLNILLICAAKYASRSPQRNPDNPFIASPKLVKSLLDADTTLFEQVYYQLGHQRQLAALLQNANQWYKHVRVLPDVQQYFPYAESQPSTVQVLTPAPAIPWPETDALRAHFDSALAENDAYCQQNPKTRYLVDKEKGRIWVQRFENEGRRRAYWLNSPTAPAVFNQLMNNSALQALVERQANATAYCESVLCEEVSMPILSHNGRNWHLDKLADQIKVMVPLSDITPDNGPLRWLDNTTPEQLIEQQLHRPHLHHSFIYSGMNTTVANFINNSLIGRLKVATEQSALAKSGQALMFDTRCIHSGSLCTPGEVRKTLTLTYKINSLRNNALNSLPCFY